jgi:hypothetical protein
MLSEVDSKKICSKVKATKNSYIVIMYLCN